MKNGYLKKLLPTLAIAICLAASSYGFDLWKFVAGPDMPPPMYKVELANTSPTYPVHLGTSGIGSTPGMPATLAISETQVLDFIEMDMKTFATNIDTQSVYYPESAFLDCPTTTGSHYSMDFMFDSVDPVDPTIITSFYVHVEFCMIQKCDVATSPYPGTNGYIKMTFTEM